MASNMNPKQPVVDEVRMKDVFHELKSMDEKLDPDPLELGPKRMNHKIAKVRNMLKRCVDMELQISEDLHWFKRSLTREQGKFELEFQSLIANNPHVRAGRSAADREAQAKVMLATRVGAIQALQESVQDLEALLTVVKTKAKDVRDIQSRLKDQMKIVDHELALGGKWGFAPPTTYDSRYATAADTKDMESMISEIDSISPEIPELEISPVSSPESESPPEEVSDPEILVLDAEALAAAAEVLPGTSTVEAADEFLEGLVQAGDGEPEEDCESTATEVDIDSLLAGL